MSGTPRKKAAKERRSAPLFCCLPGNAQEDRRSDLLDLVLDHMPVGGVFPLAQIADKPQRHLQGIALKVLGSIDLDVDLVSVQGIFIIKGVVYIGAAAIGQGDGGGAEEKVSRWLRVSAGCQ